MYADAISIEQVLLNLMMNALEAMVHDETATRCLVVGTSLNDGDHVCFSVRDRGPGLPVELSERAFEPFFTTKAEGMGLGLPISRSIIDHHGGATLAYAERSPAARRSSSNCRRRWVRVRYRPDPLRVC